MSRSALARSVAILSEASDSDAESVAEVDFAFSLRVCDVEIVGGSPRYVPSSDEELIEVGGRWDRRAKRWAGDADTIVIIRVPRGSDQEVAARWLAEWMKRYNLGPRDGEPHWLDGNWYDGKSQRTDFRRVWTLMLEGGRRGGKSFAAVFALVLFCALVPGALAWAVSPTQDETDELEQAIRGFLPASWYKFRGGGAGKPLQFQFANGSRILCLSGHKPRALKRGRVDIALYNEAQNMHGAGWRQLRGAAADRGGLVICACNPPDSEIGRWIEDLHERGRARKIKVEVFAMTAKTNPFVEVQSLHDMADENDELTYQREVLGIFVPIGDTVMHAWSDKETVREVPATFVDVTAEVTRAKLGREFGYVVGMDFQQTPHMAAVVFKFFRDPDAPSDEPMMWAIDEVIVDDADEEDLIDALEALPRWTQAGRVDGDGYRGWALPEDRGAPSHCAVVMDASAAWQDGAHTQKRTSELVLRRRDWKWLYTPWADAAKNPNVTERCKVANARLKAQNGKRRLFSSPINVKANRAMRSWENKGGYGPNKRSQWAHACDAFTYPVFRFYGKPKPKKSEGSGYTGVRRFTRKGDFAGV
jgi:hypothetical protein